MNLSAQACPIMRETRSEVSGRSFSQASHVYKPARPVSRARLPGLVRFGKANAFQAGHRRRLAGNFGPCSRHSNDDQDHQIRS